MKLFHLLKTEHALHNLEKRRLKIAKLDELNDPFELVAMDYSKRDQRKIWRGWKQTQSEKWGVLCFSRTWANPLLWSHYADKHKGMCLGFEIHDDLLLPVHYTQKRLNIDIEKLQSLGKLDADLMNKILRTKFIDWKYEKEVRVFSSLSQKDEESGLYFSSFDEKMKLTDVIAGPLCDITKETIRSAIQEQSSVNILKARLAFKSFSVVKNEKGFLN